MLMRIKCGEGREIGAGSAHLERTGTNSTPRLPLPNNAGGIPGGISSRRAHLAGSRCHPR